MFICVYLCVRCIVYTHYIMTFAIRDHEGVRDIIMCVCNFGAENNFCCAVDTVTHQCYIAIVAATATAIAITRNATE